jgi:carboxyl-terminal processing protease
LFEKFIKYAEGIAVIRNLNLAYYDLEDQIKLYIKASLAEQLYDPNIYAKIKSESDAMLQKVLELDNPKIHKRIKE